MARNSNGVAAQELREQEAADPNAQLRVRAAWIYYIEGRTQNEVADQLGLQRITVTRLLSEARRRGEVKIDITASIAEVVKLQRAVEQRFDLERAVIAPFSDPKGDPTRVIAAAAGRAITEAMTDNLTVGVGWGRTLYTSLPFIAGRPLQNFRVISLLGGIAQARRFNPAEFAWQFAELFDGEGYLVPAPALVDSAQTKHALLEFCGIDQIFQMAEMSDMALLSVGGISTLTTSYRLGHVTENERISLQEAGAVGDILYNFIDAEGALVKHPVNSRAIATSLERLRRIPKKILVSGGPEKLAVLRASLKLLHPTTLVTDEQTAQSLLVET